MNFYDFLKQKYDNYKIGKGCESCPCKMFRDKMFGGMRRGICIEEMIYLAKNIMCMIIMMFGCVKDVYLLHLKLQKKYLKRLIKYEQNGFLSAYQATI